MVARAGQDAAQMPFIRNLASSDRKLRTASLEALTAFLASRRSLPDADARKLWTGLYYALWMTDRPKPQQALAADLAALLFALPPRCAAAWLSAFWHVLGAQWTSIEALRLDKFLLLVRRVFAAMVQFATGDHDENAGDGGAVDKEAVVLKVCSEYVFDGENGPSGLGILPLGLRLHVLDIWVDELDKAGVLEDDAHTALVRAMGDMVQALGSNGVKPVRERAKESYDDERLPWGTKAAAEEDMEVDGDDGEDEDGDEWGGIDD